MKKYFIILLAFASLYSKGQITISGIVKDSKSNEQLPGVAIIIKGSQAGTSTDMNGHYSINADSNQYLVFSYLGYTPQEKKVGQQSILNVSLTPNSQDLNEYVVVGYGIQKKSDVTGAVGKIDSEGFEESHSQDIAKIIQGRTAGVTVTSNSGSPGSEPNILVRGISSINGTPPLWVVDGVPISGTINALDIASMEILKDASAAAIYGTKAAGGVILVTTKKGEKGQMQLNYENRFSISQFPKFLQLTDAKDWARLRTEAYENAELPIPDDLNQSFGTGTNWQREISRNAFSSSHFLSASGGTEKLNYYMSFNHADEQGIIQKSDGHYNSFRINSSAKIRPWLKMGENLSVGRNIIHAVNEEDEWNAVLIEAISIDPITKVRKDDGSWDGSKFNTVANPVAHLDRTKSESKDFNFSGDAYADVTILKNIVWSSKLGYNQSYNNFYDWTPSFFVKVGEENHQTSVSRDYYESRDWVVSSFLTWNKDLKNHHFKAMAGYEAQQSQSEWFGTSATDLLSENEDNIFIDNASGNIAASSYGLGSDVSLESVFGRINYSFSNKYFATINMRRQGSSKFGANHRWGNFPSASLGWNITNEPFLSTITWLNNLKLRAGYGVTGNDQSLEPYRFVATTSTGQNYVVNGQIVNGIALSVLPNSELHWEEKRASNIGLDLSALNDRLSFTGDFFVSQTKDMLLAVEIPGHVGAELPPTQNIASMKNTGFEFDLGYKNKISDFSYDLSLSFSHVKNEVTDLGSTGALEAGSFMQLGYISRTETGQPMANFYGYITDGLFQNQTEVDHYTKPDGTLIQPNAKPGDIKYKADSQGNLITDIIGSPFPDFTAGLNMRFSYKNLSFIAFFYGVYGNEIFNASKFYTHNSSVRYNVSTDLKNRWLQEGDTDDPNLSRLNLNDANNSLRSDRFIEDGSYLRLKNIQLEYQLPHKWLDKLSIHHAKIFIGSDNLFTLTNYTGFDPEIGIYHGMPLDRGIDRAQYPSPKTYYLGLSIQL